MSRLLLTGKATHPACMNCLSTTVRLHLSTQAALSPEQLLTRSGKLDLQLLLLCDVEGADQHCRHTLVSCVLQQYHFRKSLPPWWVVHDLQQVSMPHCKLSHSHATSKKLPNRSCISAAVVSAIDYLENSRAYIQALAIAPQARVILMLSLLDLAQEAHLVPPTNAICNANA